MMTYKKLGFALCAVMILASSAAIATPGVVRAPQAKSQDAKKSSTPKQGEKDTKKDTKKDDKKDAKQAKKKAAQSAREIVAAMLAKEGIKIDKKNGLVHAEGKIVVTRDFLEFVAIGPSGKKHEALVMVRCRGSSLNAALLALGLKPGKNVDFVEIVPRPTLEEYEAGAPLDRLVPATGPQVWLSVSWHDENEKLVEKRVEDLIIDVSTEKPLANAKWVFTKALVAAIEKDKPPVFVADLEGNYISTYYAKPDSHFITIVHESGRNDANWYSNTEALPAPGTECTLTISTRPRLPGDTKATKPAGGGKKGDAKRTSEKKKEGGETRGAARK